MADAIAVPLFDRAVQWLHENVSPYCLSAMLVFAASLNPITAYLFVAAFVAWISLVAVKLGLVIYRRGILRWLWDNIKDAADYIWTRLLIIKDLYWVKVVLGVLGAYVVGSSSLLAYHHLDIVRLVADTMEFIINIPRYLFDSRLLILAIHKWLNKAFLSHIVFVMSTGWNHVSSVIIQNPAKGLLYILGGIGGVFAIFELSARYLSWLPAYVWNFWRTSVIRAEEQDRQNQAQPQPAAPRRGRQSVPRE